MNAEELTTLTIEFLAEHQQEAALAVVLGIVWHLVWERPKRLSFQNVDTEITVEEAVGVVVDTTNSTTSAAAAAAALAGESPNLEFRTRKAKTTVLRGNLKHELQTVLEENEALERMVRDLRSEIERKDHSSPTQQEQVYHHPLYGMQSSSSQTPTAHNARLRNNPGIIRSAIAVTTHELDLLGSCWALLVLGFCLVSSRGAKRKRGDNTNNPLSKTIRVLEASSIVAGQYARDEALPAVVKIKDHLSKELEKLYVRMNIDPESSTGRAIATAVETFRSRVGHIETIVYDRMLPVASRVTTRGVDTLHRMLRKLAGIHIDIELQWPTFQWKTPPPTILLSEHEETVQRLEESLHKEETQRKQLSETNETLDMALKGKEVLLYEERLKKRFAKLEAAKVTAEREETRLKESRATAASALQEVAEDQKRLLRGFLEEHILARQQQERLRRIDEKNAPKVKSQIVLPDPILQGFASAMYINNLSDLSSEYTTSPSERQLLEQRIQRQIMGAGIIGGNGGDFPTDCRDDAADTAGAGGTAGAACDELDDDYYANPNETRLRDLKEQFLRSKTVAHSLRPSQPLHTPLSAAGTRTRDDLTQAQASTGSLLWSAANPATKAKDSSSSSSHNNTTKHLQGSLRLTLSQQQQQQQQKQHQHQHQHQPSSWMEDPASIMCDWRTSGNEDSMRE